MGGPAQPKVLTGSDQQVVSGPARYLGYSVRETGASTAGVRVYDGTDTSGKLLPGPGALAANAEVSSVFATPIYARDGLYVDIVSGAVAGSILVG